ncbi:hypothetical protein [Alkalibacterium sp. 20]|uniref:hypothetical protein n=1 Tax=Alkalibacterium sp. 20 TaxID=1798803 RepID=UPI0009001E32|nr:hypothetical protein [Alkalibacterium sp. 20]OJF96167.1 hypothetical protein AX762_05390 [Alkalibacterium sp. 20]
MILTKHAIERFKERIHNSSYDDIYKFITEDIKKCELLYSINGIEKWRNNQITYVVAKKKKRMKIITIYSYQGKEKGRL